MRLLMIVVFLLCSEGVAVSGSTETLNWEWPADRTPDTRILVRIDSVGPSRSGLSPSIAGYMREPMELTGTVLAGSDRWIARSVSLRLPKPELPDIAQGALVGLGIIGETTCICINAAPDGLAGDAADAWLSAMPCGD